MSRAPTIEEDGNRMKFARLGPQSAEKPVVLDSSDSAMAYDLSGLTADLDGSFLARGGLEEVRWALADGVLPAVSDAGSLRVGSPVARPSAVVCIGLNYAAHAAESGVQPPEHPVVFLKTPNTVGGPHDPVAIPLGVIKPRFACTGAIPMFRSYVSLQLSAPAGVLGLPISASAAPTMRKLLCA